MQHRGSLATAECLFQRDTFYLPQADGNEGVPACHQKEQGEKSTVLVFSHSDYVASKLSSTS